MNLRRKHSALWGLAAALVGLSVLAVRSALAADVVGQALQQNFIWRGVAETTGGYTVFRKTFSAADVSAATLNIFADAHYVVWINGQYVQRGPCRFDPAGPEYDSFAVTPFLTPGSNTLAVMVMSYPVGWGGTSSKMKRHPPGLTARLTVGSGANVTNITTDATWKWKNNLRYKTPSVTWPFVNDSVDARLDDGDWTQTNYNDSAWSAAAGIAGTPWGDLRARTSPLLPEQDVALLTGTLPASFTGANVAYFSLPRMVQGYFEIDVESVTNGSSIKVEVGERGSASSISDTFSSAFNFTAKAGRMKCFNTDSMGFRYLRVTSTGGGLTLHGLRVVERRYPYTDAGSFTSSDAWLNDLWGRAVHTIRMCSDDGYMDCTLRERAEWMGDAAVVEYPVSRVTLAGPVVAGQPLRSDSGLMKNMIRHTAQSGSQYGDGRLKAHSPSDRLDIHAYIEDYSCLWVQSLRQVYDHTGDTNLITEVWPALTNQMQWFLDRRSVRGLVRAREFIIFDNPLKYVTCEGATLNAFVYRALVDAAALGNVIGQTVTASNYLAAAATLQTNFNQYLWDAANGTYYGGLNSDGSVTATNNSGGAISPTSTGHAAMLALDRGIVPTNRIASVQAYFLAKYNAAVGYPYTAFWALEQLYGLNDSTRDLEAINYIRSKWNGVMQRTDTGTLTEGFNSGEACHNFGGSCAYFLSSYLLGVRMDGPARDGKLIVEPRLSGLTSAQGSVVTELGVVPVAWTFTNGQFNFSCTIPAGATATLRIPQLAAGVTPDLVLDGQTVTNPVVQGRYAVFTIGAGAHQVTANTVRRWKGGGANLWDVNTSTNWLNSQSAPVMFPQHASVSFDDSGSTNPPVSLVGAVSPSALTVNASRDYTFAGTGSLTGPVPLVKSGSGSLTLNTTNTGWTGDTWLQGGTVVMGNSASLGTDTTLFFNGGTLAIAADFGSSHSFLICSNAPAGIDTRGRNLTQSGDISSLAGAGGGLTKSGTGTLTIQGAQNYAGPTIINAGTLKLGASLLPQLPASGLLYRLDASAPATLTLNGTNISAWANAAGGGISFSQGTAASQPVLVTNSLNGKPVVRFGGAQKLVLSASTAPREIIAVVNVKNPGDGNIGGFLGINSADTGFRLNSSPGSWAADGASTLVNGAATASYTANTFHVAHRYGTTWGTWATTGFGQNFSGGGRYFNGGVAEVLVYGTALSAAARTNVLAYLNAKWLGIGGSSSGAVATLPTNTAVNLAASGTLLDLGGTNQTVGSLAGAVGSVVTNGGSLAVGGDHSNQTFSGTVTGTNAFFKQGSGTFILHGRIAGPVTVNAGTLGGNGGIGGATVVKSGATLSPGAAIGGLNFSNTLTLQSGSVTRMEVSHAPLTNDQLRVAGALTCGGTLDLVNVGGALAAGDHFKLFTAGVISNSFAALNRPALATGLTWNTGALATDGCVWVVTTNPPAITAAVAAAGGGAFVFNGTGGTPGWSYVVLTSTNMARPLNQWTLVRTNVFDAAGNFAITNPINHATPQNYYRLQVQ